MHGPRNWAFPACLQVIRLTLSIQQKTFIQGAWVAQLVERLTSAGIMISWFVGSSPTLGSVLTAQSLEPASDSVSPSISDPPPIHVLSLSQK